MARQHGTCSAVIVTVYRSVSSSHTAWVSELPANQGKSGAFGVPFRCPFHSARVPLVGCCRYGRKTLPEKWIPAGSPPGGTFPVTPLNRPMFTRFGAVARWDFQERARLILPNEDGGCKSFLRNLATPLLEPARQVPWGRSQVSQIRTKREIRQYPSNRESLFESDYADEALASI